MFITTLLCLGSMYEMNIHMYIGATHTKSTCNINVFHSIMRQKSENIILLFKKIWDS